MTGSHPKAGTVLLRKGGSGPFHRGPHSGAPSGIIGPSAPPGCPYDLGQPYGYSLRSAGRVGAEDGYSIVVLDRTGQVLLTLGPFFEIDVVATWRALGEQSGLPLLIEHGPGDLRPVCDQIGRVRLGRTRSRRRHASLSGRRPRFLVKRKPGRMPGATRESRLRC